MSKIIFRTIGGRTVPMVVEEELEGSESSLSFKKTPKHSVTNQSYSNKNAFTAPNATCLSCGKDVFYYENSFGSRVLFDSLGPPWPIHPCYANHIEKKDNKPMALGLEWNPVIIDKGIITSSGGLKIQGSINKQLIRFFFEEKTFIKMRIAIEDVKNMIVYGNPKNGKVQTHTGKATFSTTFDYILEKEKSPTAIVEESDTVIQYIAKKRILNSEYTLLEIYNNDLMKSQMIFKSPIIDKHFEGITTLRLKHRITQNDIIFTCKSAAMGLTINLNILAVGINHLDKELRALCSGGDLRLHFVGVFDVKAINKLDYLEGKTLITGTLNNRFKGNYLIDDPDLSQTIYQKYGGNNPLKKLDSIIVMDNEEYIELSIDDEKTPVFKAKFLSDSVISKIGKVEKLKKVVVLGKTVRDKSIEDQIERLSAEISNAMVDAFLSAKRKQ